MVEIRQGEELRVWLEGQAQEVAFVIAARCALRVQPFLARVIVADFEEHIQKALFLDSFRAAHTSCVAAVFPRQGVYSSSNASTTRAYAAYFSAASYEPGGYGKAFSYANLNAAKATNAVHAANAANAVHVYDIMTANKARYAVVNADEDLGYCGAVSNAAAAEVANASYFAEPGVQAEYSSPDRLEAQKTIWTAFSVDCSNSERMDSSSLLALPVWPDGRPAWFETEIQKYFALLDSPEWEFWKRWYLGMLDGNTLDWAQQREIANIPNVNWEAGPERIADVLKRGLVEKEFLRP